MYAGLEYKFVISHDLFQGKNSMQDLTVDVTEMDSIGNNDRIVNEILRWRPTSANSYFQKEWTDSDEGKVHLRLSLKNPSLTYSGNR